MKRTPLRRKRKGTSKHRAWAAFSKFIRQRERDENGLTKCISCENTLDWRDLDAGHYVPASVSLALRFNEINVNPQCTGCNRFRHGNLTQYALALKKKYGDDVLERLDTLRRQGQGLKYYESDYREIAERYESLLNG